MRFGLLQRTLDLSTHHATGEQSIGLGFIGCRSQEICDHYGYNTTVRN